MHGDRIVHHQDVPPTQRVAPSNCSPRNTKGANKIIFFYVLSHQRMPPILSYRGSRRRSERSRNDRHTRSRRNSSKSKRLRVRGDERDIKRLAANVRPGTLIPYRDTTPQSVPTIEDSTFRTKLDVMKPDTVLLLATANAVKTAHFFTLYLERLNGNNKKTRVITAESLTAGLIMSTLVDIPNQGWSKYGCFGVYNTSAKEKFLGVRVRKEEWSNVDPENTVYTHRCAAQMAIGALINSNNNEKGTIGGDTASFAISVTGQAMPWKMSEHTLGKVHIGFAVYVDEQFKPVDVNQCPVTNICVHVIEIDAMQHNPYLARIWKTRPAEERNIEKRLGSDIPHWIDGFNDVGLTSIVSQIARYTTVSTALYYAKIFLENLYKYTWNVEKHIMTRTRSLDVDGHRVFCEMSKDTDPLMAKSPYTNKTILIRDVWPFLNGGSSTLTTI